MDCLIRPLVAAGPPASANRHRVLSPVERISEVLFGLIMVLTFTGSLSVAEAGREDIRTMLIGALGWRGRLPGRRLARRRDA